MSPKGIFLSMLIGLSLVNLSSVSSQTVFCYNNGNCDESSTVWAGACKTGKKQSPINLPLMLPNPLLPQPLTFNNGYSSQSFYIINNGHTIQITLEPTPTSSAEVTGYGLSEPYVLAQAHFHWGSSIIGGSEHTLWGIRHGGEIHFVHYKKSYGSFSAAVASGDPAALAVVGVLLKRTPTINTQADMALAPIIKNHPTTYDTAYKQVNEPLNLAPLLPKRGEFVYRYDGSLTTPNCSEIVLWTVGEKLVDVSFLRIAGIIVKDEDGESLEHNYRSVQPINGRAIKKFKIA